MDTNILFLADLYSIPCALIIIPCALNSIPCTRHSILYVNAIIFRAHVIRILCERNTHELLFVTCPISARVSVPNRRNYLVDSTVYFSIGLS